MSSTCEYLRPEIAPGQIGYQFSIGGPLLHGAATWLLGLAEHRCERYRQSQAFYEQPGWQVFAAEQR